MPKLQMNTGTDERRKGDNTSSLPFVEGALLFLIGLPNLKLEAYPTPKCPENWYQDDPRILSTC